MSDTTVEEAVSQIQSRMQEEADRLNEEHMAQICQFDLEEILAYGWTQLRATEVVIDGYKLCSRLSAIDGVALSAIMRLHHAMECLLNWIDHLDNETEEGEEEGKEEGAAEEPAPEEPAPARSGKKNTKQKYVLPPLREDEEL